MRPDYPTKRWRACAYGELVDRDKCSLDLLWRNDESDAQMSPKVDAPDLIEASSAGPSRELATGAATRDRGRFHM